MILRHFKLDLSKQPELKAFLKAENPSKEEIMKLKKRFAVTGCFVNPIDETKVSEKEIELSLFQLLSGIGQYHHLELIELSEDEKKEDIKAHDYFMLRQAIAHDNLAMLQYMEGLLSLDEIKKHLSLVCEDIEYHSEKREALILHFLSLLSEEEIKAFYLQDFGRPFRALIYYGYIKVCNKLQEIVEEKKLIKIMRDFSNVLDILDLHTFALSGRLDRFQYIFKYADPEKVGEVIKHRDFILVGAALAQGHVELLKYFILCLYPKACKTSLTLDETINHKIKKLVKKYHYHLIIDAIKYSIDARGTEHLDNLFKYVSKEEQRDLIKDYYRDIIQCLIIRHDFKGIQYINRLLSQDEKHTLFTQNDFELFKLIAKYAPSNRHKDSQMKPILEADAKLFKEMMDVLSKEEIKAMLLSENYDVLCKMKSRGNRLKLESIKEHLPEEFNGLSRLQFKEVQKVPPAYLRYSMWNPSPQSKACDNNMPPSGPFKMLGGA